MTAKVFDYGEIVAAGEYDISGLNDIKTVLDIGANVGAFSEWAMKRWPGCSVTAYEPIPWAYKELARRTIHMGRLTRVQAAVTKTGENGTVTLHPGVHNTSTSSIHDLGLQEAYKIRVPAVHPDQLPAADFVKVDTEGCEVEIIEEYLGKHRPKGLVCEYHSEEDGKRLEEFIKSKNYNMRIVGAGDLGLISASLEPERDFSQIRLHLGLPHYGPQLYAACEQARAMVERMGLIASMTYMSDSLVSRCRNIIARMFLDSQSTHLLMIDNDIIFRPEHVRSILDAIHDGAQVIGGLYPLKQRNPAWCLNAIKGEKVNDKGWLRVHELGTGFLCIARSVFDRMIAAFPEIAYRTDDNEGLTEKNGGSPRLMHDFFSVGVWREPGEAVGRLLSEDWYFCRRCHKLGIPVYAHTRVQLRHQGSIAYPLDAWPEIPE